jgi:transcriptional regulator with XRE-family HTH domain
MRTLYDEYIEDKEFERIMAQENLIMDATESILEILHKENLNRSKLANIMGKTRGYISQRLNGRRNITLRSLSDIAYHLGYYVDIVFRRKTVQVEQISLDLDWDISRRKAFPSNRINLTDDYPDILGVAM